MEKRRECIVYVDLTSGRAKRVQAEAKVDAVCVHFMKPSGSAVWAKGGECWTRWYAFDITRLD